MKLLVIVNHYAPDRGGGGATYTDMCRALAQRGFDIRVACPYPFYPEWRDKSGRNGFQLWRYQDENVEIIRFGLIIPRNPRALFQRLVFELSIFFSALRLLPEARKADAIMVYCPYFGMVIAGAVIRLLTRKPCWLNIQDVMSDAAHKTGMFKSASLTWLLSRIERYFFSLYPVWSTISPVMLERLKDWRSDRNILFLPNWLDKKLEMQLHQIPVKNEPGAPLLLLYAGNISGKQDLQRFCTFLAQTDLDFHFSIFGNGGEVARLRNWIDAAQDPRFSIGDFLDAPMLACELRRCDFHVITEKAGSGSSFFPSKYVGGIAAGAPTLAICDREGPLGVELEAHQTGLRLDWSGLERLPALLRRTIQQPELWRWWQRNALNRAMQLDRDHILDWLADALQRLCHGQDEPNGPAKTASSRTAQ